jgi:hypothetical protein
MSTPEIHELKAQLKFGPKLSRQLGCEFALDAAALPPCQLRPELLAKLRPEIQRLAKVDRPRVQAFIRKMRVSYPELSL